MQSERWRSCTEIFDAALERPPNERAAFLDKTCDGDEPLRRKVELLLKYHEEAGDFIESPAFEIAPELLLDDADALIGQQLGQYRIESVLGVGGMGVVYLAQDERLGRKVGLKLLPPSLVADETQLERLKREARTASALNHPNIVTIHDIAEADGTHYIATEFIQGTTLRERIAQGPIPPNEACEIAAQVASALSVAHTAGIVHCDIKPENIMLRPDGYVKVLDFGIAKFTQQENRSAGVEGTRRYMSPEQARGEELDARSDIWSLGVTLREMTAAPVPPELERVISHALSEECDARYGSATELRAELERVQRRLEAPARSRWRIAAAVLGTLVVAVAIFVKLFSPSPAPLPHEKSIAVLPFDNATGNTDTEYLSDGMAEALINSLTELQQLKIIARSTAFRYKGKEIDPQRVGRELNVETVLMGVVRQVDDRLNVQVDLVDATTGAQLWGQEYERKLADVLAVKQALVREVTEKLRLKLTGEQRQRLTQRDTTNPEAYQFYLRGRYYWNKRTAENLKKSLEQFQQAADKDPNYALAYAGLSDSYVLLELYAGTPANETLPKAKSFAERALQLDSSLAEVHTSLGYVYNTLWQWNEAEDEFKRAIKLNPNYPTAHHWYGMYLLDVGRMDEAKAEIKRAHELDPLSLIIGNALASVYLVEGDASLSIAQNKKVVDLDPNFPPGHELLGLALLKDRRYAEAIAELEKAVELSGRGRWPLRELGYGYAISGKRAEAQTVIKELVGKYEKGQAIGQDLAAVYAGLGDKDQAFAWLEKDFQTRSGLLAWTRWTPVFASLHTDPRFHDLLRRMGFQLPAPSLNEKSIAVLPFENLSNEKENDYFADGIQDQILTKLASVADLKVISRISTAKYKSKPENLKTVSQELGVATVLEGTVQRAGDRVRVNVQLIDARTDTHLWAKSYDRELKDVFDVQSEVSQQIADALRAKLSPSEAKTLAVAPTRDPEAYDLFLRGEYEMRQGESALTSPEPFDRAARSYREALNRDPRFALAAARLAYSRLGRHWFVAPFAAPELEEVKSIVDRAVALAPELAEAHVSLALFHYWGHREYDAALAEFQRALQLQPNNAAALQFRAAVYRRQGQWERSLGDQARAADLDPRDPKIPAEMAGTYCNLRQWSEARRVGLRALVLDPQQVVATHAIAFSYVNGEGDLEAAKRTLAGIPGNMRTNNRGAVATMIGYHAYLRVLERDFTGALKEAEKENATSATDVLPASVRTAICLLAGDEAGARLAGEEARAPLEAKLLERPDDIRAISQLCWVYLALGRNADALRLARQRAASLSTAKDAYWGPSFELGLAEIQARSGEARLALKTLRRLLTIPAGATVSLQRLKIDPVWDPIRGDPEFQQLLAGTEQIGPLK